MDNQPFTSNQPDRPVTQTPITQPTQDKHAHKFIPGYVALIILVALAAGIYIWQHKKVTTLNKSVATLQSQADNLKKQNAQLQLTVAADKKKLQNSTVATTLDKSIQTYSAASLFQKCQANNVNATGTWGESSASVSYHDFNGDNVQDVLVSAKIPGTMGYSQGCVYTVKDGKLVSLWHLGESDFIAQSTLSVNSKNQIVYKGLVTNSTTAKTVIYVWSPAKDTFTVQT